MPKVYCLYIKYNASILQKCPFLKWIYRIKNTKHQSKIMFSFGVVVSVNFLLLYSALPSTFCQSVTGLNCPCLVYLLAFAILSKISDTALALKSLIYIFLKIYIYIFKFPFFNYLDLITFIWRHLISTYNLQVQCTVSA